MIAKITYGSNAYGVLAYAESKEESLSVSDTGLKKEPGFERLSVNNFNDGNHFFSQKSELARGINEWSQKSKRAEKFVFHASIALPSGEQLSNQKINELAVSYMNKMGYASNPFVVYKHNDTHHSHVHIISSRVGENGKLVNPSFEFKKNKTTCRTLEKEFGLQQVSSEKGKNEVVTVAEEYSYNKTKSFKSNVLQNIEFALTGKKINTLENLKTHLQSKNIEFIYTDERGERLPKNGVLFYRLNESGKRESRLKGYSLGKSFGITIEKKLNQNLSELQLLLKHQAKLPPVTEVPKLSYQQQISIASALNKVYNELAPKGVYSENDLLQTCEKHLLKINIKHNKAGFNGFSVQINGHEYKPSDFNHNSIKLSSAFLKQGIYTDNPLKAIESKYQALFIKHNSTNQLSQFEFLNILNRNGLKALAINNQVYITEQTGQYRYSPENSVLKADVVKNHIEKDTLDFDQINLYNSVLFNREDSLSKLSRHNINFTVYNDEPELTTGLETLTDFVEMQNRIRAASVQTSPGTRPTIKELIEQLNRRGLRIDYTVINQKVSNITITDTITNRQLNQYSLPAPFNNLNWNQEKLSAIDFDRYRLSQTIKKDRAVIFSNYERSGHITPEHLILLKQDPLFAKELIRVTKRFDKIFAPNKTKTPMSGNKKAKISRTARGDENTLYGQVTNNTYFDDMWDNKSKSL